VQPLSTLSSVGSSVGSTLSNIGNSVTKLF
jgi:hypothetical protein